MMQAPAMMLCNDSRGTPPKMLVILHPIAVTAPKPIRSPPKNCFNKVKPSLGSLNLNSLEITALKIAPMRMPKIIYPVQRKIQPLALGFRFHQMTSNMALSKIIVIPASI